MGGQLIAGLAINIALMLAMKLISKIPFSQVYRSAFILL